MGFRSPRGQDGLVLGILASSAACFVFGVIAPRAEQGVGIASFDTYAYFYPNVLHALRSLRRDARSAIK